MMSLLDISVNEIYFTFLFEHCLTPQTLTEGALSPVHPCGFNCLVPQLHLCSNMWGQYCSVGNFSNVFQDGLQNWPRKTPVLQMSIKMWDRNLWLKWKQRISGNFFGKPCASFFEQFYQSKKPESDNISSKDRPLKAVLLRCLVSI